ncbi:hypothetical protein [Flammeovirga kamogawensis]|uniref:Uncharacterized protein n=1 Tax=Flammeovirga kamogawensis TaxID=373891 RepID=A0ABX8H3L1_9BACT|nr:hypothetical protein [Flammeovirga kamogawensis]MBB6461907.1 hypothetical protein [Flammeovirga kamogawensis]QWG10483.1 hypothetical protein KM029_26265 [Flammeovirga kamogawensis]
MRDFLEIIKGFLAVVVTFSIVLVCVHFILGPEHNAIDDVPQTHVYTGENTSV